MAFAAADLLALASAGAWCSLPFQLFGSVLPTLTLTHDPIATVAAPTLPVASTVTWPLLSCGGVAFLFGLTASRDRYMMASLARCMSLEILHCLHRLEHPRSPSRARTYALGWVASWWPSSSRFPLAAAFFVMVSSGGHGSTAAGGFPSTSASPCTLLCCPAL